MEECRELLYNDPKKLEDKEECFLSKDHYFRAKIAMLFKHERIGEYVLFDAGRQAFFSNMVFVYILGIDDTTGKIFSRRLNIDLKMLEGWKNPEKMLRWFMGFTHHRREVRRIRANQIIRLQGDLAMRVEKTFSTKSKMLDYLWNDFDLRSPLWREFIMRKFAGDKVLGMVNRLINVLDELSPFGEVRYIGRFKFEIRPLNFPISIISKADLIRNEVLRNIRKELGGKKIITGIDELFLDRIREKKEEFKEFVINKEEKLKLTYGHSLFPHLVQIMGILIPPDDREIDQENARILVLRTQDIIITHEEHGMTTFKIDKPAIVQFGTLDQFSHFAFRPRHEAF